MKVAAGTCASIVAVAALALARARGLEAAVADLVVVAAAHAGWDCPIAEAVGSVAAEIAAVAAY